MSTLPTISFFNMNCNYLIVGRVLQYICNSAGIAKNSQYTTFIVFSIRKYAVSWRIQHRFIQKVCEIAYIRGMFTFLTFESLQQASNDALVRIWRTAVNYSANSLTKYIANILCQPMYICYAYIGNTVRYGVDSIYAQPAVI